VATCISEAARKTFSDRCRLTFGADYVSCAKARQKKCPPADVQPVIEQGKDGINLLGVYQLCYSKPTVLAPYPPGKPMASEAMQQAELEKLKGTVTKQSAELFKLRSRASAARKIELGPGFFVGLGLVAVGGVVYFLRR